MVGIIAMALEWLYEHWKSEFLANGFNEDVAQSGVNRTYLWVFL